MLSAEKNALITRTGPDAPAGRLMRRYWHPIALEDELQGERPAKTVRAFGQDFVLFRDEQGRIGLIDRDCPHRGADLAFGRLEDGGLRCPFHGWLFDVNGQCLEIPAEPAGSPLCANIRQRAYPTTLRSGMIFAYLGEGEPPAFPAFDCFVAPETHTFAFKGLIDCNWLQAVEVGMDPAHASFLHRFFEDEDPADSYGRQFRSTSSNSDMPMTRVLREYVNPTIDTEATPYGLRIVALRQLTNSDTHVRVTNVVFPNAFAIPMSDEMTITQWHVPIDDTSCYWYAIFTSFGAPANKEQMRAQRLELYQLPDYRPNVGKFNNYGFDVAQQRSQTYTGMGFDINVHDQWAVESQGPIQDRTREHLAYSDRAIIAYRRQLMNAIEKNEKGESPLMALSVRDAESITGPAVVDGIARNEEPRAFWEKLDTKRRSAASWGKDALAALR